MMGEDERTQQIRVTLVEDHPDFRNLMNALLGKQSDIDPVAQGGSLAEACGHTATRARTR